MAHACCTCYGEAEQNPAVLPGFLFWQFWWCTTHSTARPVGCQCLTGKRIQLPGRTCTVKMCACMWRASGTWATLALSTASCRCVASMFLLSAALTGVRSLLPQQTGRSSARCSVRGPLLALCVTQAGCGIFCLCSSLSGPWRAHASRAGPRERPGHARVPAGRGGGRGAGAASAAGLRRTPADPAAGGAACCSAGARAAARAAAARRAARRPAARPQVRPERAVWPAAVLLALRCSPSAPRGPPPCCKPSGAARALRRRAPGRPALAALLLGDRGGMPQRIYELPGRCRPRACGAMSGLQALPGTAGKL